MRKTFKATTDTSAKRMFGKYVRCTWIDHEMVTAEKLSDIIGSDPRVFVNVGFLVGLDDIYFIVQMAGNPKNANDHNNDHYRLLKGVTMLERIKGEK